MWFLVSVLRFNKKRTNFNVTFFLVFLLLRLESLELKILKSKEKTISHKWWIFATNNDDF